MDTELDQADTPGSDTDLYVSLREEAEPLATWGSVSRLHDEVLSGEYEAYAKKFRSLHDPRTCRVCFHRAL